MSFVLESISLKRGSLCLFDHLSFSLSPGEILEIVGSNGTGKTSLLKMLARWLVPFQGHIKTTLVETPLYVGLTPGFDESLTAQENLKYIWALEGQSGCLPPDCEKVFNIQNFWFRPVHQLSAGQRQRVHLTRLIFVKRRLWLLDEPFTSLDPEGQQTLRQLCLNHQQQQGMIVLASPDPIHLGRILPLKKSSQKPFSENCLWEELG